MKYFIAYKQDENTYLFVNAIGSSVNVDMSYAKAIDFMSLENAKNVCEFLNEYDKNHEYIAITYKYSLTESK